MLFVLKAGFLMDRWRCFRRGLCRRAWLAGWKNFFNVHACIPHSGLFRPQRPVMTLKYTNTFLFPASFSFGDLHKKQDKK